ncbi:MAG: methionyl-tRNA formyltransferase [Flavobacteriaceae bacterium]
MGKRIIFFGTPEFAGICLSKILENKFELVAVVTAPDKPSGRGKKITFSAVKKLAEKNKLKILQPNNLSQQLFIDEIKSLKPDLIVVVAFRMLPKVVWTIPPMGTINLHASLLPNYRGAAPINWVIINQEKTTGVTTFFIDEKIDSGKILLQQKLKINSNLDAGSLYEKLAEVGSELVCDTINGIIDKTIRPKVQKLNGKEKRAPKLDKQNTFINWSQSPEAINAKIKGLSPYPGAKTNFTENNQSIVIKIFETEILKKSHNFKLNKVLIKNREILIAVKDGFLKCKILQFPNRKRMSALDILNGHTFSSKIEVN